MMRPKHDPAAARRRSASARRAARGAEARPVCRHVAVSEAAVEPLTAKHCLLFQALRGTMLRPVGGPIAPPGAAMPHHVPTTSTAADGSRSPRGVRHVDGASYGGDAGPYDDDGEGDADEIDAALIEHALSFGAGAGVSTSAAMAAARSPRATTTPYGRNNGGYGAASPPSRDVNNTSTHRHFRPTASDAAAAAAAMGVASPKGRRRTKGVRLGDTPEERRRHEASRWTHVHDGAHAREATVARRRGPGAYEVPDALGE